MSETVSFIAKCSSKKVGIKYKNKQSFYRFDFKGNYKNQAIECIKVNITSDQSFLKGKKYQIWATVSDIQGSVLEAVLKQSSLICE